MLREVLADLPETLLRVLPSRCATGLRVVGRPGRDAPVLVTGNYRLTVRRLRRALRGRDAWLLVANSRGINVWCAATGGLLTHHDILSVLKTSGVEEQVDHRRLVLPQLAATGVERRLLEHRSGWKARWGPVDAGDLPAFLDAGMRAAPEQRRVRFPWPARLEMAAAWAFPISLLSLLLLPWWPGAVLPLAGLVWVLALALFLGFPIYEERLRRETARPHRGLVLFDVGERGLPLILWLLCLAGLAVVLLATDSWAWPVFLRWAGAGLVVLLLLCLDLTGSTPTWKSGLHPDRLLQVVLDRERCRGAGDCATVCPTGVLEMAGDPGRKAAVAHPERCVRCGACIVQCPFDALCFQAPDGARVAPETIRRHKLNLLGRRTG